MSVEFEEAKMVEYSFKNLEELELAYAITIHKSQGSEYPAVIIPVHSGPRMLMTKNLLYTAVTRATPPSSPRQIPPSTSPQTH